MKSEAQEKAERLHHMLEEVMHPVNDQLNRMEKELTHLREENEELKQMIRTHLIDPKPGR